MKIGHWIPSYTQSFHSQLAGQLMLDSEAVAMRGDRYVHWSTSSCDLTLLRNVALWRAMENGFDYLCMQDADVFSVGKGSPVKMLLETAQDTKAAVIGAPVVMRYRNSVNVLPYTAGEVYDCSKLGTGLVLIDIAQMREIADTYEGPFFFRTYKDKRGTVPDVGADVFFSYLVRSQGKRLVCDARIPTTHAYLESERLTITGDVGPQTTECDRPQIAG